MAGLTSQQQAEFAALRRALSEGDHEMVVASFEILQSLGTPLLPLLDVLGQEDDEDEETDIEALYVQVVRELEESAIPVLATYLIEEEGSDLLLDIIAERLGEYGDRELLEGLKRGLRDPDERIRDGVREYLYELATDNPEAEQLLDEFDLDE